MHKGNSQFMQRRADLAMLSGSLPYDAQLTPEQTRENLVTYRKRLVAEASTLPKASRRRREINAIIHEVEVKIHEIRASRKAPSNVMDYYVTATKEIAGAAMAKIIMDRAVKLAQEATEKPKQEKELP